MHPLSYNGMHPYFTASYKITGRANRPVIIFQVLLNAKALTSDAS